VVAALLLATSLLGAGQAPPPTCETNPDKPKSTVSFDSKGVDFAPWIRRLVRRIRPNWHVPAQAATVKGCVVVSFRVLKDGSVVDVIDVSPSATLAFTDAAHDAIVKSAPVEPLPAAYPEDSAVMTVTFYYNDALPGAGLTSTAPPAP
jgi:TonB family protein